MVAVSAPSSAAAAAGPTSRVRPWKTPVSPRTTATPSAGELRRLLRVHPGDVADLLDGDRDLLPVGAVHRDIERVRVPEESGREARRRILVLPAAATVPGGAGAGLCALLVHADVRSARVGMGRACGRAPARCEGAARRRRAPPAPPS